MTLTLCKEQHNTPVVTMQRQRTLVTRTHEGEIMITKRVWQNCACSAFLSLPRSQWLRRWRRNVAHATRPHFHGNSWPNGHSRSWRDRDACPNATATPRPNPTATPRPNPTATPTTAPTGPNTVVISNVTGSSNVNRAAFVPTIRSAVFTACILLHATQREWKFARSANLLSYKFGGGKAICHQS